MEGELQPRYEAVQRAGQVQQPKGGKEETAALESRNEIVTCTRAACYKDEEKREVKMKDDKGVKEEERARRKRSEETFSPLDAAIPGRGGGVPT